VWHILYAGFIIFICRFLWRHNSGLVAEEEIRPFLMSHFLSARAFSKVIADPAAPPRERAEYLVATLRRYQWLSKYARALAQRKNIDLQAVFGAELNVCDDMITLLPSKIDRMHFHGESGLSI
jgi:hypothetical protein